jgi:hypothetical protein
MATMPALTMAMPEDENKCWINFLLYNNTQLNEKMHNGCKLVTSSPFNNPLPYPYGENFFVK